MKAEYSSSLRDLRVDYASEDVAKAHLIAELTRTGCKVFEERPLRSGLRPDITFGFSDPINRTTGQPLVGTFFFTVECKLFSHNAISPLFDGIQQASCYAQETGVVSFVGPLRSACYHWQQNPTAAALGVAARFSVGSIILNRDYRGCDQIVLALGQEDLADWDQDRGWGVISKFETLRKFRKIRGSDVSRASDAASGTAGASS